MTAPVPASTYRLQLNADFTLFDAAALVPYLHRLGVDWVYLSPVLAAEPGSNHGYDVTDPLVEDPERGGRAGLEALATAAHDHDMGVLVDIVPNHMGIATPRHNPYWWDVLTFGEASRYAHWFDIDWSAGLTGEYGDATSATTPAHRPAGGWCGTPTGKVVQAVLGSPDDLAALEIRELDGAPVLGYHEHVFPVAPGSLREGMTPQELHAVQNYRLVYWRAEDTDLNYRRFFSIKTLAGVRVEDPEVFQATHARVLDWCREGLVDGLRIDHIDGLAHPQDYLERLCRLTGAYVVAEKILAIGPRGTREEVPTGWIAAGAAGTTGYDLVPYVDGALTDRWGFFVFEALRQHLEAGGVLDAGGEAGPDGEPDTAGEDGTGVDGSGQGASEAVRAGTARLRRGSNQGASAAVWSELTTQARHLTRHPTSVTGLFTQIEHTAKSQFAFGALSGEMLRLARRIKVDGWEHVDAHTREVVGADPLLDVPVEHVADVFGTICAALSVYRVYAPVPTDRLHALALLGDEPRPPQPTDTGPIDLASPVPPSEDGRTVLRALARVRTTARSSVLGDRALAYIGAVLTSPEHPVFRRFVQTTGAIMAKGVEDTSFYRYAALTALAEVGGRPAEPLAPAALATEFGRRFAGTPAGINSLTTHDTKRSEDTRARILALAELPGEFVDLLARLRHALPLPYRATAGGTSAGGSGGAAGSDTSESTGVPVLGANASVREAHGRLAADTSFDILLWQAVIGAWPAEPDRLVDYALKAAREAGLHTRWTDQDADFESALEHAVRTVCADTDLRRLLDDTDARIRTAGWSNSLAAKTLQMLAPGVPDVYRGTETWDRSLVDPDNRRPVDWEARGAALDAVTDRDWVAAPPTEEDWETGRVKTALVTALLHLRTRHRDVFVPADVHLVGPPQEVRRDGTNWEYCLGHLFGGRVLAVTTRLPLGLEARGGWKDTVVEVDPALLPPLDLTDYLEQVLAETDPERPHAPGDRPHGESGGEGASGAGVGPAGDPPVWRDVVTGREFTGHRLAVADLLQTLPVAVLERTR
ncbi:alpha-amylase family glycosyl hydrolase [Brevibacterium litoralis]|uniref:alpha-amylase family glycosyl hydrolase n=1 Tax=Brevibacterium litoralis TaxID=3138935 RepID=UPI0032EE12DD